MSYGGLCAFCGERVEAEYAAYRVSGVEYTRDQGGANVIHDRERQPGWIAHKHCHERDLRRRRQGIHPAQESIL